MRINKKKNAMLCAELLNNKYPNVSCSLEYDNDPWKLLVMSRLSAQCTDARVNIVSQELFKAFPNVTAMAKAKTQDIEKIIFPCGLYRTKAKDISKMCAQLIDNFNGKVPDTMNDLLLLSGVGRKIANLILGDIFGKGGIVADTHCIRISGRLGFTSSKNPAIVEKDLDKLIPKAEQSDFCDRLVVFGRETCRARNPVCSECMLSDICPEYKRIKGDF